ncbi:hypothetical protein [Streptomyces sp. NPDC018833]|uniref:hypothetical protein n=1 Tax=Streptomyces sp. NPDC018833 TaxID=3365053 RepID=UPI0037BBD27A
MTEVDKASWDCSLRALFGEGMFASTGPRRHEDWRRDALDVMLLKTRDPRGWLTLTKAPGGSPYTASGADQPFSSVSLAHFDWIFAVHGKGAEQILVTLQGEWFTTTDIPDFESREEELLGHSRTILGRFGEGALHFTNISVARDDPEADMFNRDGAYECFSDYTVDCGVIAVSDTEIGVFWSFVID